MLKAYKYKIKPTVKQQKQLSQAFGNARYIYNWGLDRKKKEWETNKKTISYVELAKELTLLKQDGEHNFLKLCANESLQQSLRNLDSAYNRFFKTKNGFPKFKSKKNSVDSVKFINSVRFDFENWKVKVPKIGWVKLCKNKAFDVDKVKIGTLTVMRDITNEYWCTIVVDDLQPQKPKTKICEETAVGIDLGIKDYAILSDGTKYGNPKFLEKGQKRLAGLQQGLSAKTKGSRNYYKQKQKMAKLHKKIANRRSDFIHQLTADMVNRFDTICLEDLNVKGMQQNHKLANSIQSAAWGEFVRQIDYKCADNGKNVLLIDRFEPSSKTCNNCGYVNKDLTLNDRDWICPVCGEHLDRDINAAINIKKMAMQRQLIQ